MFKLTSKRDAKKIDRYAWQTAIDRAVGQRTKAEELAKAWREYAGSAYIQETVYVDWIKKNGEVVKRRYVNHGEYIELDGRKYLGSKVKDRLGAFTTERVIRHKNNVPCNLRFSDIFTNLPGQDALQAMLNMPSDILSGISLSKD